MKKITLLLVLFTFILKCNSQSVYLIKDIYPGTSQSDPKIYSAMGENVFFAAYEPVNGWGMWKTNGTNDGTELLQSFFSGDTERKPWEAFVKDGYLYFMGPDTVFGPDYGNYSFMYKTDGTVFGTERVDFMCENGCRGFSNFLCTDDYTYFTSYLDGNRELWITDRTVDGTIQLTNIGGYYGSSHSVSYKETLGNSLFFWIYYSSGDLWRDLWYSDGTPEGTIKLGKFSQSGKSTESSRLVDGVYYFSGNDNVNGRELWRSDGTVEGTYMVKDIATSEIDNSSGVSYITECNGKIFFVAENEYGKELWCSDGTEQGTYMVKDIAPYDMSSRPKDIFSLNDKVIFRVTNPEEQLWVSNGTEEGTNRVFINTNLEPDFMITYAVLMNDKLYFKATTEEYGYELWVSDGTEVGTYMVKDIHEGEESGFPNNLTVVNDELYFYVTYDPYGENRRVIWKTDGTSEGTIKLEAHMQTYSYNYDNHIRFINSSDRVIFEAKNDSVGYEMWCYGRTNDNEIRGYVLLNEDTVHSGEVFVYEHTIGQEMRVVDTTLIQSDGSYLFNNISSGNYLIYALPDITNYPNVIPQYYPDSYFWEDAENLIVYGSGAQFDKNIYVDEVDEIIGDNAVSGNISDVYNQSLEGVKVLLVDPQLLQVEGIEYTDQNGDYQFLANIGTYEVLVDIPGLPMDSVYEINTSLNSSIDERIYYVGEDKVYIVNPDIITEVDFSKGINIYPVPASNDITISIEEDIMKKYNDLEYTIYSNKGEKILTKSIDNKLLNNTVSVKNFTDGIYLLIVKGTDFSVTRKIIIAK